MIGDRVAQGQTRIAERQATVPLARVFTVGRRVATGYWAEIMSIGLLLLMAANFLSVLPRKAITVDEVVHIPAGYFHLVEWNFTFNAEHPPLVKMWAALPLLLIQPTMIPLPADPDPDTVTRAHRLGVQFWEANRERFELMWFWSRVPMVAITLALGAAIFVYARQLFGPRAGVLAVALFSIEPTVLAHGRVVHTDVPAALAYLVFFFALYGYVRAPTLRRTLWLGLASGLAPVTKYSMLALVPVIGLAVLTCAWIAPRLGWKRVPLALHAVVMVLIAVFVLNAAYFLQRPPLTEADVTWLGIVSPGRFDALMFIFGSFSPVVPPYFLFGAYKVYMHNTWGHAASLLGQYGERGWWYYFPIAFALKTTIPFLLLSVAALGWASWRLLRSRETVFVSLLAPFALYVALSATSHMNIGVRHFLPAFPFLFILGGALLDRMLGLRFRRAMIAVTALCLAWMFVESGRAYPDYMAYMNELAWEHPHWYYLSDSNVEWGDDVPDLARYLRARDETAVRGAFANGWSLFGLYEVEYLDMVQMPKATLPQTRYVAIGASFLNGSTVYVREYDGGRPVDHVEWDRFAEYRSRTPEAVFGRSIYLYRASD